MEDERWPWVVIGSGFGGSVAGLRLTEKGHRVLMLEQGSRFAPEDFPKSNWNLKRWLWIPVLGWRGIFRMTWFRHMTVFSGVGVGGGSLVYANTLPTPGKEFFQASTWAHLGEWEEELAPHYETALRMLGANETPFSTPTDDALRAVAEKRGESDRFTSTRVAVYFGEEGVEVPDPYFDGEGPTRTGCDRCGGCMIGCRNNAKNTLDKNYLHLAEKRGMELRPNTEVVAVRALREGGYELRTQGEARGIWPFRWRVRQRIVADRVVFSGGVLGTVPLLQRMAAREDGLPELAKRVGDRVRSNSEALMGVLDVGGKGDLSKGVAIGSIYQTDEHSNLEPVRYPSGSGFFRLLVLPHSPGSNFLRRAAAGWRNFLRHAWRWIRTGWQRDFAAHSSVLLYMRSTESTLKLRPSWLFGSRTELEEGPPPTADMPESTRLLEEVAEEMDGLTASLATEGLFSIPSTAHILGGCAMGKDAAEGVIDAQPVRLPRLPGGGRLRHLRQPRRQPVPDHHRAGGAGDELRTGSGSEGSGIELVGEIGEGAMRDMALALIDVAAADLHRATGLHRTCASHQRAVGGTGGAEEVHLELDAGHVATFGKAWHQRIDRRSVGHGRHHTAMHYAAFLRIGSTVRHLHLRLPAVRAGGNQLQSERPVHGSLVESEHAGAYQREAAGS